VSCIIETESESDSMNKNLLIVGAGVYGLVAKEIAEDMGCFENIAFVDDNAETTPNGIKVVGKVEDLRRLSSDYDNIVVAIGNPRIRLGLIKKFEKEEIFQIVSLISPKAYVAPSAEIEKGCIVEPMAVIHTNCEIKTGCIISAGAVVNHVSTCCEGVHVDCNATVEGYCFVPAEVKIHSGEVYKRKNS